MVALTNVECLLFTYAMSNALTRILERKENAVMFGSTNPEDVKRTLSEIINGVVESIPGTGDLDTEHIYSFLPSSVSKPMKLYVRISANGTVKTAIKQYGFAWDGEAEVEAEEFDAELTSNSYWVELQNGVAAEVDGTKIPRDIQVGSDEKPRSVIRGFGAPASPAKKQVSKPVTMATRSKPAPTTA